MRHKNNNQQHPYKSTVVSKEYKKRPSRDSDTLYSFLLLRPSDYVIKIKLNGNNLRVL